MSEIKGIDVSRYQGTINWAKVKESGISFVMIRAGWSWYTGGMNIDQNFVSYIEGAIASGLDVGVYLYAYDKTADAARISAKTSDRSGCTVQAYISYCL
jgi:GH25 family lysozyme M1 (1,4-beta-N-acetylmuramidase)